MEKKGSNVAYPHPRARSTGTATVRGGHLTFTPVRHAADRLSARTGVIGTLRLR